MRHQLQYYNSTITAYYNEIRTELKEVIIHKQNKKPRTTPISHVNIQ